MSSNTPILEVTKISSPVKFSSVEELDAFAHELVKAGYTVIAPAEPSTYLTYALPERKKYAHVQRSRYHTIGMKYDFSCSYVPSQRNGSGSQVMGNAPLTLENAGLTIERGAPSGTEPYSSLDAYLKGSTWQALTVASKKGAFLYPKNSYGTIKS